MLYVILSSLSIAFCEAEQEKLTFFSNFIHFKECNSTPLSHFTHILM